MAETPRESLRSVVARDRYMMGPGRVQNFKLGSFDLRHPRPHSLISQVNLDLVFLVREGEEKGFIG